jgi:ABC-type multidrug transport system fused ATPase/permease subunit
MIDPLDTRSARRAALEHLRELLRLAPKPVWATPTLVTLGLATSLAETLGIALIVAFLYAAMGQGAESAAAVGGWLGESMARARVWFGSPTSMALAILVLILARAALSHLNQASNASVSAWISEAARNRVHEQYLAVAYPLMQRHEQAQLMEVLGSETWLIADAYTSFTRIVIGVCSILVFAGFLFALSWPIALTALIGSVVLALLLRRLSRPAQALGRKVKQTNQALGELMLMTIQGLRTIRAYGQERRHHERFLALSGEARSTSLALTRLSTVLDPITEVAYLVMLCVIVAISLRLGTSLATILAAAALLYRLQPHVREIEGHLLYLAQVEPQLRSVRQMLRRDDKQYDEPGVQAIASLHTAIRFEGVSFAYDPSEPVLQDVSFEIPVGRTTALVGDSGAGKTTLINLLLRLYVPQRGAILVDGVRLQQLRRGDWLALLAVAGQDVDLIEGTVLDNIRMADADAPLEAVLDAARAAGVDEFVQPLEEGYETWVGQQGHRFSGGQRQRLGLARALLRRPQLLILDEATNALDTVLEARVRQNIAQCMAGRTVLVVSHHAAAVHTADHVIHLEHGCIVRR